MHKLQHLFKLFIICLTLSMLSGCALIPEAITLKPQLSVPKQNIGQGKAVAVKVIDARPTTSLGGRPSGYGAAANISLANNISDVVRDAVYRGLKRNGFVPETYTTTATRKLTVRILALQYNQRAGFWTAGVRINSTLEATANNAGQVYDRVYRGDENKRIVFTPTKGQDSKNINTALSNTINEMLNDSKLMRFLAR